MRLKWILGAMILLAGCARPAAVSEPPELHLGQDPCAACGMTIDDARFAAALVAPDGTARLFDDIGEMIVAEPGQRAWVHDFQTGSWIDASTATYVMSSNLTTPMGGGILAVQDALQAGPLAARFHGRVASFQSLKGE
jgi:copper chaperone NosL